MGWVCENEDLAVGTFGLLAATVEGNFGSESSGVWLLGSNVASGAVPLATGRATAVIDNGDDKLK